MAYVQLGDICDVVKGKIGITKAIPGDYPMVTTGEFRKSHNEFQLDTKAVMVPLVSATGHGHASIKRIHYQEGKFAFGSILAACIPKDKSYSAKFLYIYFNLMKDYVLVPLMKGSANVSLTLGNLKTAKVPDISLEIQLKIVELYSEIKIEQDKATGLLINQENDITSLRQSILQEAVQGKLTDEWRANNPNTESAIILLKNIQREKAQLNKGKKIKKSNPIPKIKEEEIPFTIPPSWEWCRFGEVSKILNGRAYKKSELLNDDKLTPVLRVGNLFTSKSWYYSNLDLDENKTINNGDLIYAWSASFGPFIWKGGKVIYHYHIWKLEHSESLNREYLRYYLESETKRIKASGHGISMIHMTKTKMELLLCQIPPIEEQRTIVKKVNTLMNLCDTMEERIKQSQENNGQLMQSLLREVFEGEKSI